MKASWHKARQLITKAASTPGMGGRELVTGRRRARGPRSGPAYGRVLPQSHSTISPAGRSVAER